MAEIIRGGLGEQIAVSGGARVIRVRTANGKDVIFSLELPEYREWLSRRQAPDGDRPFIPAARPE